ncbi:MAG: hypothetical protein R3281_12640, partial [Balneolaceae bacterium]|nr:hypothetical protein [Balneolaceae bacterium]
KDGNTYVVNKEYDIEDLINEPENYYLRLNPDRPYWAKGDLDREHVLNFKTEKDGVAYDLNLTLFDITRGKTLGDGTYEIGDNEIGMYLLIPHARVKGFVSINGDSVDVRGTAYMDHIYQNNLSTKIIDKSYRIKTGDDKEGFFLHFITLKNGEKNVPIGYGIKYQNGHDALLTPSQITSRKNARVRGVSLDHHLVVNPFQMKPMDIVIDKHLNTYSIMDELSGVQKFFAKRFIGGELIEFNGTVTINSDQAGYFYYMVADS